MQQIELHHFLRKIICQGYVYPSVLHGANHQLFLIHVNFGVWQNHSNVKILLLDF